jgi:hypothetical protein
MGYHEMFAARIVNVHADAGPVGQDGKLDFIV